MKILVAMDSFKGSLSAIEACDAVEKGIKMADNSIKVIKKPIADGGEGTVDTLVKALEGKKVFLQVHDPLMRKIKSYYAISNQTAIIEMALASGLTLLKEEDRNPLYTSSFGVGEMIKDALDKGIREFIITIGGSATNDGGIGMLNALGVKFFDEFSRELKPIGRNLISIKTIDLSNFEKRLLECQFTIACDVNNPLYGFNGAAYVYATQKGANLEEIKILDKGLKNFSNITKKMFDLDNSKIPGAGAAGGLGYALLTYLNAKLKPGINMVFDYLNIENIILDIDLIITGEGKIDIQSKMGKVLSGIGNLGKKYDKEIIALGGILEENLNLKDIGIKRIYQINRQNLNLADAIKPQNAKKLLANTIKDILINNKSQIF